MTFKTLIMSSVVLSTLSFPAMAGLFGNTSLWDIETRKKQIQTREYATIKKTCLADKTMKSHITGKALSQPSKDMPKPVMELKATKGYGTDKSLLDLSWYLMVHSGRAMAGEKSSIEAVKNALKTWATANALHETKEHYDPYYALKRGLLTIIQSYIIIQNDLNSAEKKVIESWIDPLVRRTDKKFGGDVDHNNHRYLADSVLTLWGAVIRDNDLYAKGKERFIIALDQMRPDGSLPLETRRGARALWYMRQSLTDLILIAEIYAQRGDDLYGLNHNGKSLDDMLNYYMSAVQNPLIVMADASENYIPGPSDDFLNQDMGMMARRGSRRHYMAFSHLYLNHYAGKDNATASRLQRLMDSTGFKELPLIDDYIGANATCLWGQP